MSFILGRQRNTNVKIAFDNYKIYLKEHKNNFPPSALELAESEWYFDPSDHRCPHDGWLEDIVISELSSGERNEIRNVSIRIKILGAYHDGFIEFYYKQVFAYHFDISNINTGHRDWQYDEFRLAGCDRLHHEIEWAGVTGTGKWLIEADDVHFDWIPIP
jgi:hypothetical protein